jgi:hypothetical protein
MPSAADTRALRGAARTAGDDHRGAQTQHASPQARLEHGTRRLLLDRLAQFLKMAAWHQGSGDPAVNAARGRPLVYLLATAVLAGILMSGLAAANYRLAPLSYSADAQAKVAGALASGGNYAVFDLNLDMRGLRREHIARLGAAPEVVVLGASHWQEAHAELLPGRRFYNAHVHRDYYEDLLAVVEMLVRHDRLPKTLIMSIRDLTFAPIERRTDTLWLTALPDYRAMAERLGIDSHSWFETWPTRRWFALLSLPTLWDNARRWLSAHTLPGPVSARAPPTLDVLLADGSISWSQAHRARFTAARARTEVEIAAAAREAQAPAIDPAAVTAVDRLLGLLSERGVRVVLIHPPFNPDFHDRIEGSAYGVGLRQVEAVAARLAEAHGATVVGSFDPAVAGCTPSMFIDAEHSGPACLQRVLDQVPGL